MKKVLNVLLILLFLFLFNVVKLSAEQHTKAIENEYCEEIRNVIL